MKKTKLMMIALTLAGTAAFAGTERSGGDEVGLSFQATAAQAIVGLNSDALTASKLIELKQMLEKAKYVVVDEALFVSYGGDLNTVQQSSAVNEPSTQTIYINRSRWTALTDPFLRQEIALYELLSLIGVEGTGDYHVSSALSTDRSKPQIPGAAQLYARYFDDTLEGLTSQSAVQGCSTQKAIFESQYAIVYCSYLEKRIPRTEQIGWRTATYYDLAYGFKVWGIGKRGTGSQWTTVFSSKDFAAAYPGLASSLEYANESDAREACSLNLADSLASQPLWNGAQCVVASDPETNQYFYEIRVPR